MITILSRIIFITCIAYCSEVGDAFKYHHPHRKLDIFKRGDPVVLKDIDRQNTDLSSSSSKNTNTFNT